MTDAEKYVAVFRAAGNGVMQPYNPPMIPGEIGVASFDSTGYHQAQSMAGAFHAIADMFQGIVDAERKK